MYKHLQTQELTGDERKDKTTLLLRDKFIIENDLLYRIDSACQKRLARLKPVIKRLCVPKCFRHEIIRYVHDNCGHYAVQNLFHTLAARYFWKSLFKDTTEYCDACAVCKRVKVNFKHRYASLHPLPVPDQLGSRIAIDHEILTRKTTAGNTAVLVVVKCFFGYPYLIPVQDTTAETTARALVQHAIPMLSLNFELYSDKCPSFTSALFANVNRLLGIRHVTSAAMTARSNNQAEAVVKRLVEHLKIYAKDDLCIEECIPLIEICLKATANSKLLLSPYEVVFGQSFRLGIP